MRTKWGGVKWKAFFLEEIAQISSGKDIYERERTSGQTPYVTATANLSSTYKCNFLGADNKQ